MEQELYGGEKGAGAAHRGADEGGRAKSQPAQGITGSGLAVQICWENE